LEDVTWRDGDNPKFINALEIGNIEGYDTLTSSADRCLKYHIVI